MFDSPFGARVLTGPERRLFMTSLRQIWEIMIDMFPEYRYETGIRAFDEMTLEQQFYMLATATQALTDPTISIPKSSAVFDATVAVVLDNILEQIDIEIEDCCGHHDWRSMAREINPEHAPAENCCKKRTWRRYFCSGIYDAILYDYDYLMQNVMDSEPDVARRLKARLGIPIDYFSVVAPEPTPEQLEWAADQLTREIEGENQQLAKLAILAVTA